MTNEKATATVLTQSQLFQKITEWAEARNLIKGSTSVSQFAKFDSEFGELCTNILVFGGSYGRNDAERLALADDIGDCLVVLTIICEQEGLKINRIAPDVAPIDASVPFADVLAIEGIKGLLADVLLKGQGAASVESLVSALKAYFSAVATKVGLSLEVCLAVAYNDIKDRTGVMYKGTFIKSTDPNYEAVKEQIALEAKSE